MSRIVNCVKLKKEAEGLPTAPFAGEVGQRVFNEVSAEAWKMWLNRQTILINEYRLSSLDSQAKQFLRQELEKFLFEDEETDMPKEFNSI